MKRKLNLPPPGPPCMQHPKDRPLAGPDRQDRHKSCRSVQPHGRLSQDRPPLSWLIALRAEAAESARNGSLTGISSAVTAARSFAASLLLAALLAACSSAPPPAADLPRREAVLESALGQIGRPYRYGGGDGDGFDCSGLVQYVFDQAGVSLPRTASLQYERGDHIDSQYAAPGDLVFFRIDGRLHVAIYVGDGRFVHAPASGQEVKLAAISAPYWQEHLVSVVRVLQ